MFDHGIPAAEDGARKDLAASDERVSHWFVWSVLLLGNLLAAIWLAYLVFQPVPADVASDPPSAVPVADGRQEAAVGDLPLIEFVDVTESSGLRFRHFSFLSGEYRMPENVGSGCAFFDFDNDGDQDVLLVNGSYLPGYEDRGPPPPTTALFRNDGLGAFDDVTSGSGLDVALYGMGVAVGDYDGDGRTDVFLAAVGANRLFRNLGDGKFVDVTQGAGVGGDETSWSTSCGFFDYDRDGWLDLFVCTYGEWSMDLDRAVDHHSMGVLTTVSPLSVPGSDCVLFRNRGDGTFADVSQAAGVHVRNPASGLKAARALAVRFCDLDHDGWLDVIVANDLCPAFLLHNQGNGTFLDIGRKAGTAFDEQGTAVAGMGVDVVDLQGKGDLTIAITNFNNKPTVMYREQGQTLLYRDESTPLGVALDSRSVTSWGVFFF